MGSLGLSKLMTEPGGLGFILPFGLQDTSMAVMGLAVAEVLAAILLASGIAVRSVCVAMMALCAAGGFVLLLESGPCGCFGGWPLAPEAHFLLIAFVGMSSAWLFDAVSRAPGSAAAA